MKAVRTQPIKEGGCCRVTILKMAGLFSWALISEIKDGGNPGVTGAQIRVINPPNPYIRPPLRVGFQIQSIQRFRYKSIQALWYSKVVSIVGRDRVNE